MDCFFYILIFITNSQCTFGELFVTNFIVFGFSRFRNNLLAANRSIIRERAKFDVVEKYANLC
jgi:hypothetical protein